MRLRTSLFDRRYQALPAGDVGKPPKGEAGASHESWYADIQGGGPDVNPELSGSAKFAIYDEMALTDPTIKSIFQFWSLTMRSGVWGLDPRPPDSRSEPDSNAKAICDYVAWNVGLEGELGEMDLSWKGQIGLTTVTGLKHGPSIEELVWDDVRTWRDADGDEHLTRPLAQLAPRPAWTIGKVVRSRGRVVEIGQILPGTKPMPRENLCYIVFDPEDTARWEGSSMIRSAWAAWRMKKALQLAAGMGWDRFASGLPVIYHPDDPDAERRARQIASDIRQHERAFANFPSTGMTAAGRPESDWFIELMNGAATLADPVPLLRYFTEQEVEAGLAHFSRLGTTEHGSRSVGEVQIDPFYLGVMAAAELVARERERQVFRRIVEVNFGVEAAERYTPKLTVSKIQARSLITIAQALNYLSSAGFTFTDRGAVDDLRELLGFGQLDEAAEQIGISRENLLAILREQGFDSETIAQVVNALPPEMGVAPNREGEPLGLPAARKPRALPAG